ncbi:Serine/threonine-protein phosphatase 2A activator 2 [Hypocenomyce scalaris]|nr:Serine/threonine-protein phosphatase 2A activator 2 [Hypocenomyce scalaris]
MPSAVTIPSKASDTHSPPPNVPDLSTKLPRLTPRKRQSRPRENPLPPPPTPPLAPPPDLATITFTTPSRGILTANDHEIFLSSPTYSLILSFVFFLSDNCSSESVSSAGPVSSQPPIITAIFSILSDIEHQTTLHPPDDLSGSRFGNPSFRPFLDSLSPLSHTWHEQLGLTSDSFNETAEAAMKECSTYLLASLGSRERIDYGSGHELHFLIWLLCLNRLNLLPPSTFRALALLVFPRYISLMRHLQKTYYLEPAGSHGVWGLDDYHFLPFLFGASQLKRHPYITPLAVHNELLLEEEGDQWVYLGMVREMSRSKSVKGLKWTQPMLDDISGAKDWGKVEAGMRRMFVKEVLGKTPVMQHFLFGGLVPASEGMSKEDEVEAELGDGEVVEGEVPGHVHVHRGEAWGDCCGIKIPSTVAADQEARKRAGKGEGLRRVPFD